MSKADSVYRYVDGAIRRLQVSDPWSKAMLAKLRRAIGKNPADTPEVWEITLSSIPEEILSKGRGDTFEATEGEIAIHAALTLYALHQQGTSVCVSESGASFPSAIRKTFSPSGGNSDAIKRRFDATVTSGDIGEFLHHARGLIQIVKSSDRSLRIDYPQLAKDIYSFQFAEGRSNVRLRWGQDFYRMIISEDTETNEVKK